MNEPLRSAWDTTKDDPGKWTQKRRLADAMRLVIERLLPDPTEGNPQILLIGPINRPDADRRSRMLLRLAAHYGCLEYANLRAPRRCLHAGLTPGTEEIHKCAGDIVVGMRLHHDAMHDHFGTGFVGDDLYQAADAEARFRLGPKRERIRSVRGVFSRDDLADRNGFHAF